MPYTCTNFSVSKKFPSWLEDSYHEDPLTLQFPARSSQGKSSLKRWQHVLSSLDVCFILVLSLTSALNCLQTRTKCIWMSLAGSETKYTLCILSTALLQVGKTETPCSCFMIYFPCSRVSVTSIAWPYIAMSLYSNKFKIIYFTSVHCCKGCGPLVEQILNVANT